MNAVLKAFSALLPGGDPSVLLQAGRVVDGRFLLKGVLGTGGSSVVYLAEQQSVGRDIALKVLRPDLLADGSARRRFLGEIRAISRLCCPNTISVYDGGTSVEGIPYIAMEYLRGMPLSVQMALHPGPMAPERAIRIVTQVLESLEEAHGHGLLHRDLKPENLFLLDEPRGCEFVKVLDFGIAQFVSQAGPRETDQGKVLGTPQYMSPEQSEGRPLDARSDLYALATILFELLAGCPPFQGESPLVIALRKLREDPPRLRAVNPHVQVPAGVEAFLVQAMSRRVEERPVCAAEFRALLSRAASAPDPSPEGARAAPDRLVLLQARGEIDTPGADRRRERRERRMISFRFDLDGTPCQGTSVDLSAGGAFIASKVVPPVSRRLAFEFPDPLAPERVLRLAGVVVRQVVRPSSPSDVRGFAVRWLLPPGSAAPRNVADLLARVRAGEPDRKTRSPRSGWLGDPRRAAPDRARS